MLTLALVAGELSGDLLGADLMRAIKTRQPEVQFVGIGGPQMLAEGLQPLAAMEQLSVMGLVEVLKSLPQLLALRRRLAKQLLGLNIHAFIGLDAPDFNLGLAKRLKAQGIATLHYVSPTVWAWRSGRVRSMQACIDHLFCLFPFEPTHYQNSSIRAHYVGHPMADQIPMEIDRVAARAELDLTTEARYLALLPGSRGAEVARLMPVFVPLMQALHHQCPHLKFIIPAANGRRYEQIYQCLRTVPELPVTLVHAQARQVMQAADVGLLASGTATLEALLCKLPMVICYRVHPISWWLGQRLLKIAHVGLPNILASRQIVPELLQDACQVEPLVEALSPWLAQGEDWHHLRESYRFIHRSLARDASSRAADIVLEVSQHAGRA